MGKFEQIVEKRDERWIAPASRCEQKPRDGVFPPAEGQGGLWEQGYGHVMVDAASPGRQAGGLNLCSVELLAGRECRAGLGADADQTLAGLQAGQRLGAR